VYVAPLDVRLPRSDEADDKIDVVVQPDVFIVCARGKTDECGVRGAPEWLAEVLSPHRLGSGDDDYKARNG
jgi:hypothetical protein